MYLQVVNKPANITVSVYVAPISRGAHEGMEGELLSKLVEQLLCSGWLCG